MKYDFGKRLRKARVDAGLTQDELAYKCNQGQTWVSNFESGRRMPTLPTIRRLMKALKVDGNYLLS